MVYSCYHFLTLETILGDKSYYFFCFIFVKNLYFVLGHSQFANSVVNSFRWTVKRPSHTYTCIHSPPDFPPIQSTTQHWAEFYVLYLSLRQVLVLCPLYRWSHWGSERLIYSTRECCNIIIIYDNISETTWEFLRVCFIF